MELDLLILLLLTHRHGDLGGADARHQILLHVDLDEVRVARDLGLHIVRSDLVVDDAEHPGRIRVLAGVEPVGLGLLDSCERVLVHALDVFVGGHERVREAGVVGHAEADGRAVPFDDACVATPDRVGADLHVADLVDLDCQVTLERPVGLWRWLVDGEQRLLAADHLGVPGLLAVGTVVHAHHQNCEDDESENGEDSLHVVLLVGVGVEEVGDLGRHFAFGELARLVANLHQDRTLLRLHGRDDRGVVIGGVAFELRDLRAEAGVLVVVGEDRAVASLDILVTLHERLAFDAQQCRVERIGHDSHHSHDERDDDGPDEQPSGHDALFLGEGGLLEIGHRCLLVGVGPVSVVVRVQAKNLSFFDGNVNPKIKVCPVNEIDPRAKENDILFLYGVIYFSGFYWFINYRGWLYDDVEDGVVFADFGA